MVQRLPWPDKENPDPRGDLDRTLEVGSWLTPFTRRRHEPTSVGAPAWWHGDEDATETFLRGMGVKSLDQLGR